MINLTHPEIAEITVESLPPASLDALKALRNDACEPTQSSTFKLQPQQRFLRRVLSPDSPTRSLMLVHGTGTGKCHGVDTPILMHDGTIKLVQDVREGDLLMGDDSTPRQVLSLARGRDELFSITSVKGESYVVNSEHILCLQHTSSKSEVTEITVKDYLALSAKLRRNLKGYRTAIEFAPKDVSLDPYLLGVWLGDGSQRDPVITSQDARILKYVRDACVETNAVLTYQSGYDYRISSISKKHPNVVLDCLKEYDLINNKHVPFDYKVNSREVRLQVLAGLIDTDGYLTDNTYEITQKSERLADDIQFLARSVGLCATRRLVEKSCVYKGERKTGVYHRIHISGDVDSIPVKVLRKVARPRRQCKNPLRYGITVKSLGEGDYYGFMIDGNNRYVLGDFTVTHNTCTAIQVAEEYILRPEFQDKTVMVVASAAVQDNFRTQLFDMSRVTLDTVAGTLESKQCTGRRYLDMLLRIESEPKNWNNPEIRDKLERTADRIIDEFYDFMAYESFGNLINEKLGGTAKDMDLDWVHETFDNRLLIIDEAHNLKESKDKEGVKGVTRAMETLVKTANGLVLVLLTATPMFDTYDEIAYYMNLFLWNDRKQDFKKALKASDFFNADATLKPGKPEETFRTWAQSYVSFVKGENPFTFPFRLPPPKAMDPNGIRMSFLGKPLTPTERMKYVDKTIVASTAAGIQKTTLSTSEKTDSEETRRAILIPTIAVLPGNKSFPEVFKAAGKQYAYVGEPFLTPQQLPNHSAKFVSILESIEAGKGLVFVYSNYVQMGSRLFAMALEEHGYTPAQGQPLLANPGYTGASKGKYALLSDTSESEFNRLMDQIKSSRNRDGSQIKVVVASVIASEGVDFRYVRQIHVLDPWWNMSRIEQVLGRGLRTCSHQLLDFEDQNCAVYLHVVRTGDGKECFDEYTYRTKVEPKAIKIATVRKVLAESAMDCPLQNLVNTLPEDWKELRVPQRASESRDLAPYTLAGMMAPTFSDSPEVAECRVQPSVPDPEHTRPLSTYLDVRDEFLGKLGQLLASKPIWARTDLREALRPYPDDVIALHLQQAVSSAFRFKDSFGRPALLESRGDLYALAPLDDPGSTMVERTTRPPSRAPVDLPLPTAEPEPEPEPEVTEDLLETKRTLVTWPADAATRFPPEILDSYVVDHVLSDTERRAYYRSRPAKALFVDRLVVPGTDILVLGKDTFDPPEPPVGDELTQYRAWNASLLAKFIADKDVLFGSVKNGKLTVSKMHEVGGKLVRKREKGSKKFEPVVCGTGENDKETMIQFAKYIDSRGVGAPKIVGAKGAEKEMTGPDLCTYIELLCREENRCVWITPEELSVLYDGKAKKGDPPTNQDQFTEAFRK